MSTITIYRQSDFPAVFKMQVIAFMRMEWPFIFHGDGKFITEPYPAENEPVHFVAAEDDSLISYAALQQLDLEHAGQRYKVFGFGNMFTFPPYRREGYGQQVLALATDFIRKSAFDMGMLFCDVSLANYYSAYGWEVSASPTYTGVPGNYHLHEGVRMMIFVSEKGHSGRDAFAEQPFYLQWTW